MSQAMRFDVNAIDKASAAFLKVAEAAERLERKLKDLDHTRIEIKPKFDDKEVTAGIAEMKRKLREATNDTPKVRVGIELNGLTEAERKLDQIKAKMTSLSDASAQVDVNTGGSATRLNLLAQKMRDIKKLSPLKLRVEVDDQASAQIDAIAVAAAALATMAPTVRVDVDSPAAVAQIASLEAALRALGATATTVNVNLNELTFLGQLARIRTELNTIAGGKIKIDADTARAMDQLAALRVQLAELGRQEQTVVVRANTELARVQIRLLEERLAAVARNTTVARVKVDVDKSATERLSALGGAIASLKWPLLIGGIAASTPGLVALGSAALSAAGAVGVLPGALLGAVGAFATLKVGTSGVGDALKQVSADEDAAGGDAKKLAAANKKLEESLRGLAPSAREFVVAVKNIGPAWSGVKLDVQQKLFAGLGQQMKQLSSAYLPTMRSGLTGVATALNATAKDFVGFATSTRTVGNVDAIFRNITSALQAARPAVQNIVAAFLDIGVVGSELLPGLAGSLTDVTGRFRTFIDQARQSGQLKQWIQGGIDTLKTLGSITVNVGSTLGSIFRSQSAAGMSLLGTIDRLTGAMANWAKSAQGQQQLTAVFSEIRRTTDSLLPGLAALGLAAAQMLAAFANTGALTATGQAFSLLASAIAPLIVQLGSLAGGVLNNLANGLSVVATVISPIIAGLSGLLGALGPVPAAVIAMVVAFKLLGPVNTFITSLGTGLVTLATRFAASSAGAGTFAGAAGRVYGAAQSVSGVLSKVGSAVPVLGVAIIAAAAAWDALTISSGEAAQAMDAGGAAAQTAARGLQTQTNWLKENSTGWSRSTNLLNLWVTTTDEARAAMTPLQQAQLDAANAANRYNDEVARSGPTSQAARAAAEALATANDRVAAEQDKGAAAAKTHADAIRDLTGAMQSQIGSALAYEEAVRRTADAHKAAAAALKEHGAKSEEYQQAVADVVRAQDQQAQSAQRVVEAQAKATGATNGAELGLKAYNTELLRLNDGTQVGHDAFVKMASSLDTTSLGILSATAAATGLKTEILTLPDGRTVTVVTASDTTKLEQVKVDLNAVATTAWVGTVTVVGDPTSFQGTLTQAVQFANGQQGTITLNGNSQPVQAVIGQTKYNIDATTGTLTINGNPAPGEANLSGLKLHIDQTTGTITLEANPAPVDAAKTQAAQPTDAPVNLNPNSAPVDAAKTAAAAPTTSPHTVGSPTDTGPVDAAKAGASAPTSSPHTVGSPTDVGPVDAAKAGAAAPTTSPHTVGAPTDTGPVDAAKAAAQQPTRSMHTFDINDDAVRDAKQRAEQPTRSLHTFDVNDNAVTDAKRRAEQPTHSTHTITVVVTGAPIPRAIGAYATPRAQGGYAAYANGGLRPMSAARAQIVPPRQPRVIGDRMHGDEAFIPVNRSPLSQAILNTTAQRMGYNLVPQNGQAMPSSGAAASVSLSSIQSAINQRATGGGGALVSAVQQLSGQLRALRGDVDHHSDNQAILQELRALRGQLAQGRGGGSGAARAQTSRTLSELGAF